jgi:cell division protein FtsW (lipid II flippase)
MLAAMATIKDNSAGAVLVFVIIFVALFAAHGSPWANFLYSTLMVAAGLAVPVFFVWVIYLAIKKKRAQLK